MAVVYNQGKAGRRQPMPDVFAPDEPRSQAEMEANGDILTMLASGDADYRLELAERFQAAYKGLRKTVQVTFTCSPLEKAQLSWLAGIHFRSEAQMIRWLIDQQFRLMNTKPEEDNGQEQPA